MYQLILLAALAAAKGDFKFKKSSKNNNYNSGKEFQKKETIKRR